MKNNLIALGLAAGITLPMTADAFTIARGIRVNPIDSVIFEVIPPSSGEYGDFWCGAADYARRAKGASWTDFVYVVQGRSNSVTTERRTAVQFTLSSEAAGPRPQGWLHLGIKPGDRMSVQQANRFCYQRAIELR